MTLVLKNVDIELLHVIQSLKILKPDFEIIQTSQETLEAMAEAETIYAEIKQGMRKPYDSWKEAKEALLGD